MTPEDKRKHLEAIQLMSQIEMAQMWRFAPIGHIYFSDSELYEAFRHRFLHELGGFTPEISRAIGWG